ncbi:NAD(P)/FAD-dependent oxidoreductase [Rhizobium sp. NZLR1b]|uniref:phytoene desaturase family protein n=1 Tax=unclassified Rhizobium TaxID=2613769 RepID=UPI001C83BC99|nr:MULTISPECIES: NAD(P)/FAD-dependent oxidoreductase [unclassified Rhizobium]MBX5173331.1 NAD(P)/FAD-dependent oxidoreductase [Rhizobium sp. NZLR1b]MBX5192602.1 NAD(P)/FAD-dependent oxidoreductase [Rhizobium sp. NZLR3b]
MRKFDVIVIGGGHNGLVCACYLAKAGLKVCVVERQPFVGGAAISREVWPGFTISVASYWMSMLQPKIMLDLRLQENGVEVISVPPSFHPFDSGKSIVYWPDEQRFVEELAQFSKKDAANYPKFAAHMADIIPYIRRLMFETPVDPMTGKIKDITKAMSLAWRLRDIGARVYDIWDLLTLSADDYLRRWFESDEVLTAFGSYASGSAGLISPKTQGSAYVLARPYMRDNSTSAGGGGLIKGGMGSISEALLRVAKAHGVEVLTGEKVRKVDISNGKAVGVELESGPHLIAKTVVSNAGAKMTYFDLIGTEHLSDAVKGQVERHRTKSIAFKINLACNALPRWTAYDSRRLNEPNPGSVTLAENSGELEDAFHTAQNGEMAKHPYLWITTPSAFDETVAPEGKHVVQIMGGHVPYKLNGREWDETTKKELLDIVIDQICRYAPGFEKEVLHAQILTPKDIEEMFAMVDGHVHHGEMSLDQVFFRRPIQHYADYRTPISGMYMCGAACHPGGGVNGVPGHNAAREILRDLGKAFPAKVRP